MSRAWVILKRFGKLLKFVILCIILTVLTLLIWRTCSTGIPEKLESLSPNVKLKAAYSEAVKKDKELYVFNQAYDELSRGDSEGYFAVPDAKFIPDANQVQIVFRYNNSTIKSLVKDYSLKTTPQKEAELFDVSLVLYIGDYPEDTTSDVSKENSELQAIRIKPTAGAVRENTTLYNFYRFTFDLENGAEPLSLKELLADKQLVAVHVEVYYNQDIDYNENPYGALCIYDYRHKNKEVELTDTEKEALGG